MNALARFREALTNAPQALTLLEWIEPPPTLQALDRVIHGIRILLPVLGRISDEDDSLTEVSRSLCAALGAGVDEVDNVLTTLSQHEDCDKVSTDPKRQSPFKGVIGEHPLYALIGSLPSTDDSSAGVLAAVIVIAVSKEIRITGRRGADYRSSIKNACDAARLALGTAVVDQLPTSFNDLPSYRSALDLESSSLVGKNSELRHIEAIERLLRFLIRRTGGTRRGGAITREDTLSAEDTGDRPLRIERVSARTTQSKRSEARQTGLAADELAEDHEFVSVLGADADEPDEGSVETEDTSHSTRPLASQVLLRQRLISQIERANQFLPTDFSRLSTSEIALFLHELRCHLRGVESGTQSDTEHRPLPQLAVEPIVGLAVCFWAGVAPAHAVRLRLYVDADSLPIHFPSKSLAFTMKEGFLILPAARPKASPTYKKADFALAQLTGDRVHLPLGSLLKPYLLRLAAARRLRTPDNPDGVMGTDAFELDATRLVRMMKDRVRMMAQETHSRLTPTRIARTLFSRLADMTGDLACASLISSTTHRLSDTQLHYFTAPHAEITARFVRCIRTLMDEVISELKAAGTSVNVPPPPHPLEKEHIHIGSPICPQTATVFNLAAALETAFERARREVLQPDYRIELHNAFTHYVHAMLRFAIGLRDVGEPLPAWGRINRARRVILVSDKDDVASYSSRLLPLPDLVLGQLEHWARHLIAMEGHLAFEHVIDGRQKQQRDGLLFYLVRSKGRVRPARSNDPEIRAQLATIAPEFRLPHNCNRHYLRSLFVELGCPAELIDDFMGHWVRGREPWGRFSTLPPMLLVERLRPFVERALQKTGFKIVRGFT